MSPSRGRSGDEGFTLLEVLIALAIMGIALVGFQAITGGAYERALVTRVNRQMRALVEYQMGQITVGKLHPDEDDPYPDGQTGTFEDVGGYAEEYQAFTWEVRREEIPIVGANEEDLEKAGFKKEPGNSGGYVRAQTDDILAGTDEHLEKPAGQFKSRMTLIVRWHAMSADEDREFKIETYLPVYGEEDTAGPDAGGAPGGPGTPGAAGTEGAGRETLDRSGAIKKG
jgi:prepilin-type N-terminal cleavage/methylation domain-containing protein